MEFIEPELKDWIQIRIENDGNLRIAPNLADTFEDTAHGRARGKGALRRELIDNSVGQRIGKRNT